MHQIEQYYRENQNKHVAVLRRILDGDHAAAEDVFQEAITRSLKYSGSFDNIKGEFGGWFTRILYNSLSDYRRNKDGIIRDGADPTLVEGPDVSIVEVHLQVIMKVLNSMKNNSHKEILKLFLFYGYSDKEIQQITNLAKSTVRDIVYIFRNKLREEEGIVL